MHVIPSKIPAGYVAANGQLDIMLRAWDGSEEQSWSISTGDGGSMDSRPPAAQPYGKTQEPVHIKLRQKQTSGLPQTTSGSTGGISPMTLPAPAYVGCSWVLNDTIDQSAVDDLPFYTYSDSAKVEFGASKSVSIGGALSGGVAFSTFEYSGSTSKTL